MAPPGVKKKKEKQATTSPDTIATAFRDLYTDTPFLYNKDDIPSDSMVLNFSPLTDNNIDSQTVYYLIDTVKRFAAVTHRVLCGPTGVLFVIGVNRLGEKDFLNFIKQECFVAGNPLQQFQPILTSIPEMQEVCIHELKLPFISLCNPDEMGTSDFDITIMSSDSEDDDYQVKNKQRKGSETPSPSTKPKVRSFGEFLSKRRNKTDLPASQETLRAIGQQVRTAQKLVQTTEFSLPSASPRPLPINTEASSTASNKQFTSLPMDSDSNAENFSVEQQPNKIKDSALSLLNQPRSMQSTSKSKQPAANTQDMESDFIPASNANKRSRRRVYRNIDYNKLDIQVIPEKPCSCVLFRPTDPTVRIKNINPGVLVTEIAKYGKSIGVRDIRNGGIAVDFEPDTVLEPIMALTSLCGVSITTSRPVGEAVVSGVIQGVHWELQEDEIIQNATCIPEMQILSATRLAKQDKRSWTLRLTFSGKAPPERVLLYDRSHPVKLYMDKPLQCQSCGRYGHVTRTCKSKLSCMICSLPHDKAECPSALTPKCANCGGPHQADSKGCPARNLQVKICQVKTNFGTTYKKARAAVTSAVKSYSQALKTKKQPQSSEPHFIPNTNPNYLNRGPNNSNQPSTWRQQGSVQAATSLDNQTLIKLFSSLIAILTAAVNNNNFTNILTDTTKLFSEIAPAAIPANLQ